MDRKKRRLISIASVTAILIIWHLASAAMKAPVILPSPVEVAKSVLSLFQDPSFLKNVVSTMLRAVFSFCIIVFLGGVLGTASGLVPALEAVLSPVITLLKATPVMSVILLAFIWFRTGTVPVFAAFLMAFPVMYVQVLNATHRLDARLQQMCTVYGISGRRRIFNFVLPSLVPAYITGARQSLSMIWKVVIAAEVLTIPQAGVGRSLQLAQIRLDTPRVFAWTVVAVILTFTGDALFNLLLKHLVPRRFEVEA